MWSLIAAMALQSAQPAPPAAPPPIRFVTVTQGAVPANPADGRRWWMVSIMWQQETPENPISAEYLPAPERG